MKTWRQMGHWSWSSDTFDGEDMTGRERVRGEDRVGEGLREERGGEGVREEDRRDMLTRQHILRLMLYRCWRLIKFLHQ